MKIYKSLCGFFHIRLIYKLHLDFTHDGITQIIIFKKVKLVLIPSSNVFLSRPDNL